MLEEKIKKLYTQDRLVIFGFMVFLWIIMLFVMAQVSGLAPSATVRTIILVCGVLVAVFATGSLFAVFVHLKNNREELYSEDIMCALKREEAK